MITAITGHRPNQLHNLEWVTKTLQQTLQTLNPTLLYQGMAMGADLLAAQLCIKLEIPYIGVKPWAGHHNTIPDKQLYQTIVNNSQQIVTLNPSNQFPGNYIYHERNHYMVDNADIIIALLNTGATGGTAATVKYANKVNKPIIHINPQQKTVTGLDFTLPLI